MRTLGAPEILLVASVFALFFCPPLFRRLASHTGGWLGDFLRPSFIVFRALYHHLAGSPSAPAMEKQAGAVIARAMTRGGKLSAPGVPLTHVIERLTAAPGARGRTFQWGVLEIAGYNAFALPGGYVFFTRPLADALARHEACLAFVAAHEMSHILLDHCMDGLLVQRFLQLFASGGTAGLLNMAYSRNNEMDADNLAVDLMESAGFHAEAAVCVLRALGSDLPTGGWLSTHPDCGSRIEQIERRLRKHRTERT